MQKQGYRIKLIKMGEIKEESPEKQTHKPNPLEIIQRRSQSGSGSINVSPSIKRKSFQQFLDLVDTITSKLVDSPHQINKKKRQKFDLMAVSFDHTIRPIHRRTKTLEFQTGFQKIEKPSICRTKIFTKGLEKAKKQNKVEPEQDQKKSNSSPLLLKKLQIKNKLKQYSQNFDCRPWTRRLQREQTEQNIPLKSP